MWDMLYSLSSRMRSMQSVESRQLMAIASWLLRLPAATVLSVVQYNGIAVKIEVDIPIPEESVDESARERLRRDALEAAVLRLFDERHISSVEAASDLGLTRIQFMELARKRDIPQYDYTAGDLAEDLSDLEKLQKHIPPSAFPQ